MNALAKPAGRAPSIVPAGAAMALVTGIVAGAFGAAAALAAFFMLAFMAAAIADYRAGIVLAILLLPLSATNLIPRELFGVTGFNPLNATLLMAALSVLCMYLFHRGANAIPAWPPWFWAYAAAVALAALHGASRVHAIPAFYKTLNLINFTTPAGYLRDMLLKPALIPATAFMLSIAVRNARRPGVFLVPLFFSCMVLPLASIGYLAATGAPLSALASSESRGTLSVIGMHANELGLLFNMGLALALFSFAGMRRGAPKWMLGLAVAVSAAAVLLTFSRGAWLGFLVLAVCFLYSRGKFSILMVGMLLIPLAILLMPQAIIERATTGAQNRDIAALSAGRVDRIWRPLLPEVAESPLIGHGLGAILWSDAARRGAILKVGHPHSAYLGALLDMGLLGASVAALFLWHMRRLFAGLARSRAEPLWRGFFQGAGVCILLLLVQGISDDRFTPSFPQTFLWLAYGIALGLGARQDGVAPRSGGTP
jgi:O-antigen ligase